jgi:hypothetical protein
MKQKFLITLDEKTNQLSIEEYAVLERTYKYSNVSNIEKDNYSFLYKETYDSGVIESAISEGKDALISILRTPNMFPIESYINEMAKSVIDLYGPEHNLSVELVFDDKDLL